MSGVAWRRGFGLWLLLAGVAHAQAGGAAASGPPLFNRDDDVTLRAELDTERPYVEQAVGYVLRLTSRTPILSGELEQPQPDGARLQPLGADVRSTQIVDGRELSVVERRFLLIPERAGRVVVPPARFTGTRIGGFFDDLFGDGRETVALPGPSSTLQVQGIPATAAQPWLPLRDLRMQWLQAPAQGAVGEASTAVLQVDVDGGTAAQLPDLVFPADPAVQVFAEPVQAQARFDGGRPQVRLTRRYTLVPLQAGGLRLAGPRLDWWDTVAGRARTTQAADIVLQVGAGVGGPAPVVDAGPGSSPVAGGSGGRRWWPWAVAGALIAVLAGLVPVQRARRTGTSASPPSPPPPRVDLMQVLRSGTPVEVTAALLQLASPPAGDLDALQHRLDDVAQCRAIDHWQRARWADGDTAAARARLRSAFAHGPRWRAAPARDRTLPPLYPPE